MVKQKEDSTVFLATTAFEDSLDLQNFVLTALAADFQVVTWVLSTDQLFYCSKRKPLPAVYDIAPMVALRKPGTY